MKNFGTQKGIEIQIFCSMLLPMRILIKLVAASSPISSIRMAMTEVISLMPWVQRTPALLTFFLHLLCIMWFFLQHFQHSCVCKLETWKTEGIMDSLLGYVFFWQSQDLLLTCGVLGGVWVWGGVGGLVWMGCILLVAVAEQRRETERKEQEKKQSQRTAVDFVRATSGPGLPPDLRPKPIIQILTAQKGGLADWPLSATLLSISGCYRFVMNVVGWGTHHSCTCDIVARSALPMEIWK